MTIGLNFQTRKIEEMKEYQVLNYFFDYEEDFLSQPLNKGADNLEHFFSTVALKVEPQQNYHIIVKIKNDEFLDYEEYFTLFSTFGFVLTSKESLSNNKDYLKVPDEIRQQVMCTDYSLLKIMNNNYDYGTIQLTIEDSFDTVVTWANNREKS